jgi:putative glutamine amidotransferase
MGNEFPPRIGITARLRTGKRKAPGNQRKDLLGAERSLIDLIADRGGLPLLLAYPSTFGPAALRRLAQQMLGQLDALVLQGGSDIEATRYGATDAPDARCDPQRDAFELILIEAALLSGKPLLGICRGCQLLNVAFGGSLFQDLEVQRPGGLRHSDRDRYDEHAHGVQLTAGGLLQRCYARDAGRVSSAHSQGVDRLGSGLVIEARCSEDGLIEALRADTGWALGVQWHPEFDGGDPQRLSPAPLLDAFFGAMTAPARDARSEAGAWQ